MSGRAVSAAAGVRRPVVGGSAPQPGGSVGLSRAGVRRRAGGTGATLVLAALVVAFFIGNLLLGSYTVTVPDFARIVTGHFTGETIPGASFIVIEVKIPQAVTGLAAGVSFGLSGALFQTLLRNPLASPDIIGISYGASAAAVLAIVVGAGTGVAVSHATVSGAALLGAFLVAAVIYGLSRSAGSDGVRAGSRLVLMGIGISAGLQAVVSFLLTRSDIRQVQDAVVWLNGSLNSADWNRVGLLGVALLILLPITAALARPLRMLELGDDAARGLGVHAGRTRAVVIFTGVALAAIATAATGPIAFVAFLAGPISRRLGTPRSGARDGAQLLNAGLAGAAIVLGAAFVAGTILSPLLGGTTLPVGVITGAVGAPVLLWLLISTHRKES